MGSEWTTDRVLALAPDTASAKAGQGLASPHKWTLLGCEGPALWGLCQGSGKNPYQTQIDLREPAFHCTCPSRKFPCKHALGLLLLWASQPKAFGQSSPPPWVTEWLESRAKRAEKREQKAAAEDTPEAKAQRQAQQAKRAASREQKVAAGMEELRLWLGDVVRRGLAAISQEPAGFWETRAARMVDAQAPGAARLLREAGEAVGVGRSWQERTLERLGRLYLLTEGYGRLDTLPPPQRSDVRTMVGWTQATEELSARAGVRDRWMILAQTVETEDRLRVQRTWLWSPSQRRPALVLSFAHGTGPLDVSLSPGRGCPLHS